MNEPTVKAIVAEIAPVLVGRALGRAFQLSSAALALDFRPHDGRFLFVSVAPNDPRLYLIQRSARTLEKQSLALAPFALVLKKHLGGATLRAVTKDEGERIVRFSFAAYDAAGDGRALFLIAQLTGRSSNLFLLDDNERIIDALRPPRGAGQEVGDRYQPPPASGRPDSSAQKPLARGSFATLSAAADDYYQRLAAEQAFQARAAAALARLRQEIAKRRKLHKHLSTDLAAHGDAAEHKRIGDLLLANIATAQRQGNIVRLTDYYAADTPTIELEVDERTTLQEEAARRFSRYGKAKRAAEEINKRLTALAAELAALATRQTELERIIAARDAEALGVFTGEKRDSAPSRAGRGARRPMTKAQRAAENVPGARRYRSSDGYEILVGRGARDNDHLTFRIARPHDLWLHAADYPGSHVVVRNPARRGEIPHRTIVEAAQLAAHFSQARADAKVSVHCAERKHISKPKGAAPGLVRLANFRTLLVEPRESVARITSPSEKQA